MLRLRAEEKWKQEAGNGRKGEKENGKFQIPKSKS
jgi:hypothetical protein